MVGAIAGGVGAEAASGSRVLPSVQTERFHRTLIAVSILVFKFLACLPLELIIVSFGNTHANTTSLIRSIHRHFVLYGLMEYLRKSLDRQFTADEVLQLLDRFFNLEMLVLWASYGRDIRMLVLSDSHFPVVVVA
ncbi:hypothetical protein BAE44_0016597 [Dichanthelium oligosanthes]|uniref:Uncharacterized protein n=1 Tax=Dichanthelium oligosanthes TaxID=888268 RepID=A0A1E5VBI1_9POAL|nr:hypothetical protein BAE44_0016597 [Dichanthelium oligosanthes]